MSNRNRKRLIVLVALMLLAITVYAVWTASSARADGSGSSEPTSTSDISDDPCFRQDPECYGPPPEMVECDNNEFVPMNADGTWTCPAEQLPEEVIGRQVDCPDGSVGRIVDVQLNNTCDETATQVASSSHSPNTNEVDIFAYGALLGAGLVAVGGMTLYFIFRKDPYLDEARNS